MQVEEHREVTFMGITTPDHIPSVFRRKTGGPVKVRRTTAGPVNELCLRYRHLVGLLPSSRGGSEKRGPMVNRQRGRKTTTQRLLSPNKKNSEESKPQWTRHKAFKRGGSLGT